MKLGGLPIFIICLLVHICVSTMLLLGIGAYAYAYQLEMYNQLATYSSESGLILLTDTYDSNQSRISDFFAQSGSENVLQETYYAISNDKRIRYYEVTNQDLTFIGRFPGGIQFVSGTEAAINQEISNKTLTPLKSLQVDASFVKMHKLFNQLRTGRAFQNKDFLKSGNEIIPVIVGSQYNKFFKCGDEFAAYSLGIKIVRYKIIGILKPSSSININENIMNLDSIIVTPTMNVSENDDEVYRKRLLSVKCEGLIEFRSKEEFNRTVGAVKAISKETGFKYEIPNATKDNHNIFGLTYPQSFCLLLISLPIYVISFILLLFSHIKSVNFLKRKWTLEILHFTIMGIFVIVSSKYLYMYLFNQNGDYALADAFKSYLVVAASCWCIFTGITLKRMHSWRMNDKS